MIEVGRLHDDFYLFLLPTTNLGCSQVVSSLVHNLWHQHFGHPRYNRFKLFSHYISTLNSSIKHESHESRPHSYLKYYYCQLATCDLSIPKSSSNPISTSHLL